MLTHEIESYKLLFEVSKLLITINIAIGIFTVTIIKYFVLTSNIYLYALALSLLSIIISFFLAGQIFASLADGISINSPHRYVKFLLIAAIIFTCTEISILFFSLIDKV